MPDRSVRVRDHQRRYTRRGPVRSRNRVAHDMRGGPAGAKDDGEALRNLDRARGTGDQFELYDINEPVDGSTVKGVVTENVEHLLRREKLISKNMHVVIPEGGYDYNFGNPNYYGQDELGYFEGNFEIFWEDTIVALGAVHGSIAGNELIDIDANIYKVEV